MKPSVAILCENNPLGSWDESSLGKGVGGSETAVIGLAKKLGEEGCVVGVYNDTRGSVGFGEGLTVYRNKQELTEFTLGDIWIAWRDPATLLKFKGRTGRKVLWLHDLVPEMEVREYVHFCDVIWVPSQFHREQYPNIPDSKFAVIPSGIIPVEAKESREENLLCYTSDYNRGLDILLEIWPKYLFRFPNDRLEVAYGTQTQEAIAVGADRARKDDMASKAWKYRWERLEKAMALKGVTHHGRLSKPELAGLYERASLMAYPSTFPETQCQVVADAQYHGCIPVVSSLGALQETANGGYVLPPDVPMTSNAYLRLLIAAREQVDEFRRKAARDVGKAYLWEALWPRVKKEIMGL